MLAHVTGWAGVVLVGIGVVVVVQVLRGIATTVRVVVGVDFRGPPGVAELAVVLVIEYAVAVVIVPIGLVD